MSAIEGKRRFRSRTVALGAVGVLAVALTSCGSEPDQRCVDREDYTSADGYKIAEDSSDCGGYTASGVSDEYDPEWYYGGEVGNSRVGGGSFSEREAGDSGGFGNSSHHYSSGG